MKNLIVYYSFSGNNRILSTELATRMNAEIYEIEEAKRRTWSTILLDLLLNRWPPIQRPVLDWSQYDKLILVAPIWNARIATPMCSFIHDQKEHFKEYAFVSLCGGRHGQLKKINKQLTKLMGRAPITISELGISDHLPGQQRKENEKIGPIKIQKADLQYFKTDIDKLVSQIT